VESGTNTRKEEVVIRAKDVFIGEAIGVALAMLAGGALAISQNDPTPITTSHVTSQPSISVSPSAPEAVSLSLSTEEHGHKDKDKHGDNGGPGNSSFGHEHHDSKDQSGSGHD